ncbi:hypothetical protein GQ53DRAFT_338406 [Thozetella sp. PMI_491]|nr:hypothetical protein GQ53DRAFT_338406 [Thozetella sp. PMI_491]
MDTSVTPLEAGGQNSASDESARRRPQQPSSNDAGTEMPLDSNLFGLLGQLSLNDHASEPEGFARFGQPRDPTQKTTELGIRCTEGRPDACLVRAVFNPAAWDGAGSPEGIDMDECQDDDDDDNDDEVARVRRAGGCYTLRRLIALSEGNTDMPPVTLTRRKVVYFKAWRELHAPFSRKNHLWPLDYRHMPYPPPLRSSWQRRADQGILDDGSVEQLHADLGTFSPTCGAVESGRSLLAAPPPPPPPPPAYCKSPSP